MKKKIADGEATVAEVAMSQLDIVMIDELMMGVRKGQAASPQRPP
jgi:hypothetical protein